MRKVILSLAMSLDGYILDEKGGYEWIHGDGDDSLDTEYRFDFNVFLKKMDVVVMGRRSYENDPLEFYKDKRIVVATSKDLDGPANVDFVNGDIVQYIRELRLQEGKDIFIYGGSLLADAFMKADIIDEFVIAIVPIMLGRGKSLFLDHNPTVELHLDRYSVQEGMVMLEYSRR